MPPARDAGGAARSCRATRTAGEPLRYAVRVRNTGKRRACAGMARRVPAGSAAGLIEFSILREPGEEERNRFDRTLRLLPLAVADAAEPPVHRRMPRRMKSG